MKRFLFLIAAFVCIPLNTYAATLVPPSGNGQVCDVTSPLDNRNNNASIRSRVDAFNNTAQRYCNQTIILKNNSDILLNGPIVFNNSRATAFVLESDSSGIRTINAASAGNACAIRIQTPNMVVRNLRIINARGTALCVDAANVRVENVTFENNSKGVVVSTTNNVITGSTFKNNQQTSIELQNATNLASGNQFLEGINTTPIQSPEVSIVPTLDVAPVTINSEYTAFIEFASQNTTVQRVEIHRRSNLGTSSRLAEVTQFTQQTAQVNFAATESDSVYAIAFTQNSTSAATATQALSESTGGSGNNGGGSVAQCVPQTTRRCIRGVSPPPLLDTDCDGILDKDEDPNFNCGIEVYNGPAPAANLISINPRGGVTAVNSVTNETDPVNPDSDGDGIRDGIEDRNKNGKWDVGESNPNDEDTDGDGIQDGDEDKNANGSRQSTESSAISVDTDSDRISDQLEDKNLNGICDTNETCAYRADTDLDGRPDGVEDSNKNGVVDFGESDPRKADTDGDGLSDFVDPCPLQVGRCEVACIPFQVVPATRDSDFDGLFDAEEDFDRDCQVGQFETDAYDADTDGDNKLDRFDPCPTNPDAACVSQCVAGARVPSTYDSDNDGDPNRNEDRNGNCRVDGGETNAYADDSDGDGLLDGLENTTGTSALLRDTDGDGLSDGEEDFNKDGLVNAGETNPRLRDTDGDGDSDFNDSCPNTQDDSCLDECIVGRVPALRKDSDQDGLPDLLEDIDSDCFKDSNETSALDPDTDKDGILDGIEDINTNGTVDAGEMDPRKRDTDIDGIPDGVEDFNQNGIVDFGECNPLSTDTDSDGVTDFIEDKNKNGKQDEKETACYLPDTDFDGINDGNEDKNKNGVVDAGETDALKADTDGDGVADGAEIINGTNPTISRSSDFNQATGKSSGCSLMTGNGREMADWAFLLLTAPMYLALRIRSRKKI